MRTLSTCAAVASLFGAIAACGPKQDPSAQQPALAPTGTAPYGYAQQPGAYPTATGTAPYGYPQQGAPQPAYTAAPTAMPTAAPTTAPGQMAVPGPAALACTNDLPCITHHCNLQYGKCAFPCQSNNDCLAPNVCATGFCVPPQLAPGGAAAH